MPTDGWRGAAPSDVAAITPPVDKFPVVWVLIDRPAISPLLPAPMVWPETVAPDAPEGPPAVVPTPPTVLPAVAPPPVIAPPPVPPPPPVLAPPPVDPPPVAPLAVVLAVGGVIVLATGVLSAVGILSNLPTAEPPWSGFARPGAGKPELTWTRAAAAVGWGGMP